MAFLVHGHGFHRVVSVRIDGKRRNMTRAHTHTLTYTHTHIYTHAHVHVQRSFPLAGNVCWVLAKKMS